MARLKMSSVFLYPIQHLYILTTAVLLVLPHAQSLYFNLSNFNSNSKDIYYEGDSAAIGGQILLTRNQRDATSENSVGRASYDANAVPLWNSRTGELTSFTTHFSFRMTKLGGDDYNTYGDGFAFFLAPFESRLPNNSAGGCLGLVDGGDSNCTHPSNSSQIVAVEFDNYSNGWDPDGDHVGIDVDSIDSKANVTWEDSFQNDTVANAWISYDPTAFNLSMFLTFDENPIFTGDSTLSYHVDLRNFLPEKVRIGFSAATGRTYQICKIISWEFNSTLLDVQPTPAPQPAVQINTPAPSASTGVPTKSTGVPTNSKNKVGLVGGIVAGIAVVSFVLLTVGFVYWKRRSIPKIDESESDVSDDFERGTGPRRFTYAELSRATTNFTECRKLGEGGFGGVYFGELMDPRIEIAVKKFSKGSKQGKKEYTSEVKTISRLRHKNLVQLLGWCHEQRRNFLLVYEFMPNGSLDSHLYGDKQDYPLPWTVRYKIAVDLSSALLYLHEEWEQCVLHRDIKSSNVMLDSNFNAKLGDFGLARLVDHQLGSQTTVLAGTLGYLAPECAITGKASKESDVYSFGVVALELACGRHPMEPREEPDKVRMVEWVWDLYGKGSLLKAVDHRLEQVGGFNVQEMKCLMMVGLWCCHPDQTRRPCIRHVIKILKGEAPLPVLPPTLPLPFYSEAPLREGVFSMSSSSTNLGLSGSKATTTSSSQSRGSNAPAPLLLNEANDR